MSTWWRLPELIQMFLKQNASRWLSDVVRLRDYWIETRKTLRDTLPYSGNLLLYWSPWAEGGSDLLDMTPKSELGR